MNNFLNVFYSLEFSAKYQLPADEFMEYGNIVFPAKDRSGVPRRAYSVIQRCRADLKMLQQYANKIDLIISKTPHEPQIARTIKLTATKQNAKDTKMPNPNPPLSEILTNKSRLCSLEVSSNRPVDYNILNKMKYSFCSISWIGNYNKAPEQVGPLAQAKEMINKGVTVVLHFTCRNNTVSSCTANLDYAKQIGVKNLMVVRGASPECNIRDKKYDFMHTPELLKFINTRYGDHFEICVAGFPYKHPDSKDLDDDMKYLKEKNDAGAKFIITQACFSYDVYKEFLDNCRRYGITMRIIPGVYIIRSVIDFCFLQKLCKVPQSDPLVQKIKEMEGNDKEIAEFGIKSSLETVKKLLSDEDFCPPHVYTMDELSSIHEFFKILHKQK